MRPTARAVVSHAHSAICTRTVLPPRRVSVSAPSRLLSRARAMLQAPLNVTTVSNARVVYVDRSLPFAKGLEICPQTSRRHSAYTTECRGEVCGHSSKPFANGRYRSTTHTTFQPLITQMTDILMQRATSVPFLTPARRTDPHGPARARSPATRARRECTCARASGWVRNARGTCGERRGRTLRAAAEGWSMRSRSMKTPP